MTVGSLLVSFTFVFGNMFKTLFESVVFLFVVHPFDVGDMISIGTTPTDPCTVRVHARTSDTLLQMGLLLVCCAMLPANPGRSALTQVHCAG